MCGESDKGFQNRLHLGSIPSQFLFTIVKDRLTDEVRQELPWTIMFAKDILFINLFIRMFFSLSLKVRTTEISNIFLHYT